jgi:hypothetical protein
VTIAQGGVLPNINTLLLPKKSIVAGDSLPVSSTGLVKKLKKTMTATATSIE